MRIFIVAVVIALWPAAALAQAMPGGGKGMAGGQTPRPSDPKTDERKKKVDDKAYNDALSRIPIPAEKHDPWRNLR